MPVRIFLSWCHRDRRLKEAMLEDLLPALGILADLQVEWWDDSHLACGEEICDRIKDRIGEADFVMPLLSTQYYASRFIRDYEWPRFAGPQADTFSLPVLLRPLAFGPENDLGGVERQLVFTWNGKSFAELQGAGRRTCFANDLASSIRRRALSLTGFRPL